ncbi:MAG: hypothetical protein LBV13_03450 [Methanomassiliicoccaceae archaeon]|nr:hypothetical protein [Methanomassiliicoccaceae archaeon]
MSKIYCNCGNIVSLDRNVVRIKKELKKKVECMGCRNHRVSYELDILNGDGILDEDPAA